MNGTVTADDIESTWASIDAALDEGETIGLYAEVVGLGGLPLDAVVVELVPDPAGPCVRIEARAEVHARTGVEMEALVAVSAAALTIYDMCKAVDRGMTVEAVRLVAKSGGKSGEWRRAGETEPDLPAGSGGPTGSGGGE